MNEPILFIKRAKQRTQTKGKKMRIENLNQLRAATVQMIESADIQDEEDLQGWLALVGVNAGIYFNQEDYNYSLEKLTVFNL